MSGLEVEHAERVGVVDNIVPGRYRPRQQRAERPASPPREEQQADQQLHGDRPHERIEHQPDNLRRARRVQRFIEVYLGDGAFCSGCLQQAHRQFCVAVVAPGERLVGENEIGRDDDDVPTAVGSADCLNCAARFDQHSSLQVVGDVDLSAGPPDETPGFRQRRLNPFSLERSGVGLDFEIEPGNLQRVVFTAVAGGHKQRPTVGDPFEQRVPFSGCGIPGRPQQAKRVGIVLGTVERFDQHGKRIPVTVNLVPPSTGEQEKRLLALG